MRYLCYYIPKDVKEGGQVRFEVIVKKIDIDISEAKKVFEKAIALVNGPMPKSHSECIYCTWGNNLHD